MSLQKSRDNHKYNIYILQYTIYKDDEKDNLKETESSTCVDETL